MRLELSLVRYCRSCDHCGKPSVINAEISATCPLLKSGHMRRKYECATCSLCNKRFERDWFYRQDYVPKITIWANVDKLSRSEILEKAKKAIEIFKSLVDQDRRVFYRSGLNKVKIVCAQDKTHFDGQEI